MRKVVITGSTKLADFISRTLMSTPVHGKTFDVRHVRVEDSIPWRDFDVFVNCAHVGFKQTELLWECFEHYKSDPQKTIINISSRAAKPNISKGYLYAAQKAALNHLSDNLVYNNKEKRCKICTINLGLMESKHDLPSLSYSHVAGEVYRMIANTGDVEYPEITIQHQENYVQVQNDKEWLIEVDHYINPK